jgi:hypothetical protein
MKSTSFGLVITTFLSVIMDSYSGMSISLLQYHEWIIKKHSVSYTPLAVVSRASTRINHCYDSANPSCFVERGHCDRHCTQHAKIPSGSSLTSDTYE